MRGTILTNLVVLSLVMASCGQVAVKPDNLPDLVTDHIITAYDHYYPGSTVELSIKLSMTPQEIWFGGNNNLKKSANSLIDGIWKDSLALKQFNFGSVSISVVLSLNDGAKKKLYKDITIVQKPSINIEQARSSKSGDKLIVWADVELSKVEYINPNGKMTPLEKKDKEFILEQKLPEPGQPAGTIRTTDSLGAVEEKKVISSGVDESKIYITNEKLDEHDTIAKVCKLKVLETSLDMSYTKAAFEIILKPLKDKDLDNLKLITKSKKYTTDTFYYLRLKCLSKDHQWAIFSTKTGGDIKDNPAIIEDGKLLVHEEFIFTFLYNTITHEQKLIGKRVIKNYTGYVRETGNVFFPVFIGDKEILLVEQMKDGKLHQITTKGFENKLEFRTPEATARAVSLSLEDQQIRPTDKVVVLSPWISRVDMSNGIIGYAELFKDCLECGSWVPDGNENIGSIAYFADLQGNIIARWDSLMKLCEPYADEQYPTLDSFNVNRFIVNGDSYDMYFFVTYGLVRGKYGRQDSIDDLPELQKSKLFRYNTKSKILTEIDCSEIVNKYQSPAFGSIFLSSTFGVNEIFFWIGLSNNHRSISLFQCKIEGDKLVQLSSEPNNIDTEYQSNVFILPGGEQ